jgi:pimeloyl-ACP methyl ester carboxylesterase
MAPARGWCYLARVIERCLLMFIASVLPLLAADADMAVGSTGLQKDVVFTDYSPLSRSMELARRLLSPLNAMRLNQELVRTGQAAREQSIDLAHEKFAVYVPAHAPPHGYALLVFVPPWQEAIVPLRWTLALDRHGMIFVSAANSGNTADVLDRREPLALLAAYNIMRRYRVDPDKIYIGGFSGGSRVAMRIALSYPDLFHAALLDAGSDPIGDAQIPLPPAELFGQFQDSTRLVYATGQHDDDNLDKDVHSRDSMHSWCVFHMDTVAMPWAGHDLADPASLNRALDTLLEPAKSDPDKLAACRARIDNELVAQLKQVKDLLAAGKRDDARTLLDNIDAHYGGLAAPRSTGLAKTIDAQR